MESGIAIESALRQLQPQEELEHLRRRLKLMDEESISALARIISGSGAQIGDIVRGLGNPRLSDEYAVALPGALQQILSLTHNSLGLFTAIGKNRGPYATSWISDMRNRGNGVANGCAYEVLATAKLMRAPISGLQIQGGDRVDFGFKLQASYPSAASVIPQPNRITVEADVIICRQDDNTGILEIGVDFKHSGRGLQRISSGQIQGVVVALATEELHEFHFVANCGLRQQTHSAIHCANRYLKTLDVSEIQVHEGYVWP